MQTIECSLNLDGMWSGMCPQQNSFKTSFLSSVWTWEVRQNILGRKIQTLRDFKERSYAPLPMRGEHGTVHRFDQNRHIHKGENVQPPTPLTLHPAGNQTHGRWSTPSFLSQYRILEYSSIFKVPSEVTWFLTSEGENYQQYISLFDL